MRMRVYATREGIHTRQTMNVHECKAQCARGRHRHQPDRTASIATDVPAGPEVDWSTHPPAPRMSNRTCRNRICMTMVMRYKQYVCLRTEERVRKKWFTHTHILHELSRTSIGAMYVHHVSGRAS